MAPELTYPSKFGLPYSQLSKEGDIYALGMVVYEIVMGIRPFGVEGFRVEEVMYVVLDGARPARPGDPEDVGFGPGVWDLVEACWGEDRTQRPNIRDVHQCLAAAADLSPLVPPGPMIVVSPTREISTGSIPPTSQSRWFTAFFTPPDSPPAQFIYSRAGTKTKMAGMTESLPARFSNVRCLSQGRSLTASKPRYLQPFEISSGCSTADTSATSSTPSAQGSISDPFVPPVHAETERNRPHGRISHPKCFSFVGTIYCFLHADHCATAVYFSSRPLNIPREHLCTSLKGVPSFVLKMEGPLIESV